ncbi:MAG: MarR family transcriptional regulator [Anaerolineae bacterium]|nr:MarR family transcriptional regulator [Anaerolineae bacterium]
MTEVTPSREERVKAIHDAFIALMWISKRQFAHRLQAFGLTQPQFMTLATLTAHKEACTMSDLIHVTFQDAPTMTGVIDRLVKMKLVERTRTETDRRVVLVKATSAGIDLVKQIETQTLCDATNGFANLTDEELSALEQLLHFILRMHLRRTLSSPEADLEAELEKLKLFGRDLIHYAKLEQNKINSQGPP